MVLKNMFYNIATEHLYLQTVPIGNQLKVLLGFVRYVLASTYPHLWNAGFHFEVNSMC